MSEPPDYDARDRPHVPIDMWRDAVTFEVPPRARDPKPLRANHTAHANGLLVELARALPAVPLAQDDPRARMPGLPPGAIVGVETLSPAPDSRIKAHKVPAGLNQLGGGIAVLRTTRNDDRTETAVMFIPDTARQTLRNRIAAYGRAPRHAARRIDADRFEVVEHFREVEAKAIFAAGIDFDAGPCWWELWVRETSARADAVAQLARRHGLEVHPDRLTFPDTIIVLVHGAPAAVLALVTQTYGAVSEVCAATGTIRPFLERGGRGVGAGDFVAELRSRITGPPADAPLISILDTGVAAAHPLIAPGLAGAHAYDEAWGTDDHAPQGGHGTGLVSLVLYGDLEGPMSDNRAVALTHRAASMKLLPPAGFDPHAPRHYGVITQGAVAQIELAHGQAARTYCLATSTEDFSPTRPSSWSGALDQIAAGAAAGDAGAAPRPALRRPKRLVVVAAGNMAGGMRDEVLQCHPMEDPAQSWNALTVGGYTAKETVAAEDFPLTPVVGANQRSPFSRGSDTLADDLTPLKPEVLFEAGNMLADAAGYCAWNPSVSLLSAGSDVISEPLTPMWATSAATGMAGHFLGQLEAGLPGLWPETYRGLTVQSAEWPQPIRNLLVGRGAHWRTGKAATKAARQRILRTVGYGVPDIDRALASARNDVTLTAQAEIQPFAQSQDRRSAVYNEMHFYDLPWPREALGLDDQIVTMKVTLSYFIEPNLSGRAATRPDTYRSFGLRFAMKKAIETDAQFRARVNAAQTHEGDVADPEASHWLLGPKSVSAGSLHCDLWRGHAIQLASHDAIAVFPVGGWWKSHPGQRRMNDRARYSLLISLAAPGHRVDLHSEISLRVEAKAAEIAAQVVVE